VILKRVAIATSTVVGGAYLGVWALPRLRKDEVSVSYSVILHTLLHMFYSQFTGYLATRGHQMTTFNFIDLTSQFFRSCSRLG